MDNSKDVVAQQFLPADGVSVRVASALVIVSFVLAVLHLGRAVLEPPQSSMRKETNCIV